MGAQPNDFRYFLTLDNERKEIIFAPDGWDSNTVASYKRNDNYFGVIRSYALPLQFVKDGRDILRLAYYKYGIEAEVRAEVERLNKISNPIWGYLPFFIGDVDFSQFNGLKDHVSVTLMQGGATKNIKAYESVKYEYPLIGDDVVNIKLPGVAYSELGNFQIFPSLQENFTFMPALSYIVGLNSGVLTPNSPIERNGIDLNTDNLHWFLKVNQPEELTFTGRIKGTAYTRIVQNSATFFIEVRNQANALVASLGSVTSPPTLGNTPFDFHINFNGNFGQDTYLFLTVRGTGDNDNYCKIDLESEISVSFSSVSPESNCKGISIYNLFKRVIKRLSPGTNAISYLLSNKWKNLIITSGDGIREIEEAKIKTSFQDLFNTVNAIEDAGFGIEGNAAVMELATYFARDIQILDFGEVKDLSLTPATEYFFNSIKIGYNDGNTDEQDGKEEYNSGQQWALPITRIKKDKDWTSPYRADQYGIEKIRVDYNIKKAKGTNDTSSDNDVFMVDCYLDGANYRPILGSSYDSVTGLKTEAAGQSAYNLNLSPKRNLLRHSGYLRSIMDKMDGRYITFGSGTKNTELKTVKDSIRVKENEDIVTSSLPGKYFIPTIATFTAKFPKKVLDIIENEPYGYFAFSSEGTKLKGYILEISIDLAKNTEQEVKLLLTNDNNLLNLL